LGLAICDSNQMIVTPLETIHRKKWAQDRAVLDKIITDNDITAIVVGYPLNMDGSAGPRCQSVKDFVMLMEDTWPSLTFFFYDERLSTATLEKSVHKSVNKDSYSAQIILDNAIDFMARYYQK
jgi:putative Holliday junction resolvase